jgi:hypothetical protein
MSRRGSMEIPKGQYCAAAGRKSDFMKSIQTIYESGDMTSCAPRCLWHDR